MPRRSAVQTPRVPRVLSGMGRLVWLEVRLPGGRVHRIDWPDRGAPVVAHAGLSPSARGKPRPCYLVGGTATLRGGRVVGSRAPVPVRRLPLRQVERALPRGFAVYARTHGGLAPREAVAVMPPRPGPAVVLGRVVAVTYRTDKHRDGRGLFRHEYENRGPELVVDRRGRPQFRGGRATVTPHGIEDLP